MRVLQRIVWSEGMLMSPQHFQQQDHYHEALLHERLAATAPYTWGVVELELDARALETGQVAVRAFAGVLPAGTTLAFRVGEAEAPTMRAIEQQHLPAHREVLDVHLALPVERIGIVNYAQRESERARTRFVVESRSVLDAVLPDQEETIDFARRNPVLLFGDEAREDFESIKIAEIVRDGQGKFVYSASYLPPALRLGVSPWLVDSMRRVLGASTAKRRAVSEELRHRDRSAIEFSADEVSRYLALHALSGAIPMLKHLTESDHVGPYQAYLFLIQFAGQLSAFSVDDDPALLPNYAHTDARATFQPLFARLLGLLQVAVATRVITINLESRVDGMHLGRLQAPELHKTGVRFVLSVQASLPEHTVMEMVPRVAKIAAWTEIPRYLNASVSTVPLAASTRPPREIPVRPGKQYFLIDTDGPLWRSIVNERTIAVHLPPPFEAKSTSIELLAIPVA